MQKQNETKQHPPPKKNTSNQNKTPLYRKEVTKKAATIHEIFNYIPGTVLASLHALTHLLLTTFPEIGTLSLAHITDEEAETKKGIATCPRLHK